MRYGNELKLSTERKHIKTVDNKKSKKSVNKNEKEKDKNGKNLSRT